MQTHDLLENVEGSPVELALNTLAHLGFKVNETWKQIPLTYKNYDLSKLVAEYYRTKSPALGYIVVTACIKKQQELRVARLILERLANDHGYFWYVAASPAREWMTSALNPDLCQ